MVPKLYSLGNYHINYVYGSLLCSQSCKYLQSLLLLGTNYSTIYITVLLHYCINITVIAVSKEFFPEGQRTSMVYHPNKNYLHNSWIVGDSRFLRAVF